MATAAFLLLKTTRTPAITERDPVLIADFVNTTGDPVFDDTLKQALAVQLQQSPYLNIVAEPRVAATLRMMERPPEERITSAVAREICQRLGVKALIAGSIASLGRQYVVTLDAQNCATGESLAQEQVEAAGKEQVLQALGRAAASLREGLGESLASIQKFDVPVHEATTSSLDALEAFSAGMVARQKGGNAASLPLLQQAVARDPNFALAHARLSAVLRNLGELDLARHHARRAYELRERVSEPERFYITTRYLTETGADLGEVVQVYRRWVDTYPRDFVPRINLGVSYSEAQRWEDAAEQARRALELAPEHPNPYGNLAGAYVRLRRYGEARAVVDQALERGLDSQVLRSNAYHVAVIENDERAMAAHAGAGLKMRDAYQMYHTQALMAASRGRLRDAAGLVRRAVEHANDAGLTEVAGYIAMTGGFWEALAGRTSNAQRSVEAALAIGRGEDSLWLAALVSGLAGNARGAETYAVEFAAAVKEVQVPKMATVPLAAVELARRRPDRALEVLARESATYRMALELLYVKGFAQLESGDHAGAQATFEGLLKNADPRGIEPVAALAQLQLARAARGAGDLSTARRYYQDFLALWKDADADLPVLQEAMREAAELKSD
jgi:tetratricopeptide (TPR) repeat protein